MEMLKIAVVWYAALMVIVFILLALSGCGVDYAVKQKAKEVVAERVKEKVKELALEMLQDQASQ